MWKFDRAMVAAPDALLGQTAFRKRLREFLLEDVVHRSQSSPPVEAPHIYETSIADSLDRLFHEKCAFCESRVSCRPYQFRPAMEAIPPAPVDPHLYYTWLADAWENLYPICEGCQPREPAYFPVSGPRMPVPGRAQLNRFARTPNGMFWRDDRPQEKQLLLDPCEKSDMSRHLVAQFNGLLVSKSKRGAETIEHFSLNRADLVDRRRRSLSDRVTRLRIALLNLWDDVNGKPIEDLFDFADQEFGGSWYLILKTIAKDLAADGLIQLGPARIGRFYENFALEESASKIFELALRRLELQEVGGEYEDHNPRRVGTPRLSRLEVENFRSIEHLVLNIPPLGNDNNINSTPCVLILGENSTGKSSLLEAAALALGDGGALDDLGVPFGEMVMDPSFVGSDRPRPDRGSITVWDEDGARRRISVGDDGYYFDMDRHFAMVPVFAYGAFRQYRDVSRRHSRSRYIRNLFRPDESLSNPERWLLGLEQERFNEVVRRLRDILTVEGDFDVIERDIERQICLVVTRIPGTNDDVFSRVPLRLVSSGYRAVVSMVCEIMQGLMEKRINPEFESLATSRGVVLIDEIEAHLHPRWKIAIMAGLRKALPGMTFIATSHDPLCLRGMEAGEVAVLRRIGAEASDSGLPARVEVVSNLPDMSQFRIDQLLTSDFFQLYSTDDPVLEGRLAEVADILGKTQRQDDLPADVQAVLEKLERDVASSLPIGDSEVQRLVQKAVADHLVRRRHASADELEDLSEQTKRQIRALLERL
ncbi:AAA family ATPase (plasmid) [Rhizobium leguminosarum]